MIIPWRLSGTERQKEITLEAFHRIKFPFEKLKLPGEPELGWRDLNGSDDWWMAKGSIRAHGDDHHHEQPEPLAGEIDGRKWIMGVFFPGSARVFIDVALEQHPELAMAVVGAEIAHAVDEFLPMTEAQRGAIMALWHKDGDDGHTWWEKVDYNAEYYTLGGEAFMHEFVSAYSDLPFGDKSAFGHHDAGVEPADIHRILKIDPTDKLKRFKDSKVYHRPSHYPKKPGLPVTGTYGLVPCKVCKP